MVHPPLLPALVDAEHRVNPRRLQLPVDFTDLVHVRHDHGPGGDQKLLPLCSQKIHAGFIAVIPPLNQTVFQQIIAVSHRHARISRVLPGKQQIAHPQIAVGPVRLHAGHGAGVGVVQGLDIGPAHQEFGIASVVIHHDAVGLGLDAGPLLSLFHDGQIAQLVIRVGHAEHRRQHLLGAVHRAVSAPQQGLGGGLRKARVRSVNHLGVAAGITPVLVIQLNQRAVAIRDKHIAFLIVQVAVTQHGKETHRADVAVLSVFHKGLLRHLRHQRVPLQGDMDRETELIILPVYLCGKSAFFIAVINGMGAAHQVHLIGVVGVFDGAQHHAGLHVGRPGLVVGPVVILLSQSRQEHLARGLVSQNDRQGGLIEVQFVTLALRHFIIVSRYISARRPGCETQLRYRQHQQKSRRKDTYAFFHSLNCQSDTPPLRRWH